MNSNGASPGFVFQMFGESKSKAKPFSKQQALFINKSLGSRNLIQLPNSWISLIKNPLLKKAKKAGPQRVSPLQAPE